MPLLKKNITILLLIFVAVFSAKAAYIENVPQIIVQPNGDTIHCFASGDEFFNWLHDENGFTIIKAPDGWYYYATEIKGQLVASQHKVGAENPAKSGLIPGLKISQEEYWARRDFMFPKDAKSPNIPNTKGVIDAVTIYIRFNDDPEFTRDAITRIHNNFSGETNSVRDYFRRVSYNQLDIRTTHIPANTSGAITSFVANQPRNHYRPYNATSNRDGYRTDIERRRREWQLLRDAINWVRNSNLLPTGLNLDNNGDGFADMVHFVVQGTAEGWNDLLWAHKWALQTVDGINFETEIAPGIRVRDYTFQPENQTSVRVLAHEAYHVLGAPDLYIYDTVFRHLEPVGRWDLMETGSGHILTHMKIRYGGWIDSTSVPVITQAGTYTLLSQGKNRTRNVFRIPGNAQEHFLVEYRQRADDAYELALPGSGLIVTRINPRMSGNANFGRQGVFNEVYVLRPGGSVTSRGVIGNANLSDRVGRTDLSRYHAIQPFFSDGSMADFHIYDIIDFGDSIRFSFSPTAIQDPINFSGRWRGDSIFLRWIPSVFHKDVVLIYDTLPITDFLQDSATYNIGDRLPSGAVVLYTGNDSLFFHAPIKPGKVYHYRVFTNVQLNYSRGANIRISTIFDSIERRDTTDNFLATDTSLSAWSSGTNFVAGHSTWGYSRFVELYKNDSTKRVVGLMFAVHRADQKSNDARVYMSVWSVGNNGLPDLELSVEEISYGNITSGGWNTHYFKNPPLVDSDFFVGVTIRYTTPLDTFSLFSTGINNLRPISSYLYGDGSYTSIASRFTGSGGVPLNIALAYRPILSSGGFFLTSLPQRLRPQLTGAENLIVDVFCTYANYEIINNNNWIHLSVDRIFDQIFVDVEPSDVERIGEILLVAENDTVRIWVHQRFWGAEEEEDLDVIVFPNPSFDGIFHLRVGCDERQPDCGEIQLAVFDLLGRLVWSRTTVSHNETIDLSGQRGGMYILRVIKNGRQKALRLVKL